MRLAWMVALVACGKHDKPPPPAAGSAVVAPAPVLHTKLVGCAPAQLAPRGESQEAGAEVRAAAPVHVGDAKVWTPYAAGEGLAPKDIASAAATELEAAIRGKLAKLDECIGEHTGSLRAVLFVAFDGGVISARVGGLGDHHVDACVAGALIGLKVGAPPIVSEVACDLSRGDPAPWRVTEDGYDVVVTAKHDGVALAHAVEPGEHSVLVVADADAPAAQIMKAIEAVAVRNAVVVGVKVDAGAPVFLGVGFDARTARGGDGEPVAIDTRGAPHACADGEAIATGTPQQVATALAARCKTDPCGTLSLSLAGTLAAKDVMPYALAARDAGFTRILVAGEGCAQSESGSSGSSSSGTGISSGGSGPSAGGSAPSIARPSSR